MKINPNAQEKYPVSTNLMSLRRFYIAIQRSYNRTVVGKTTFIMLQKIRISTKLARAYQHLLL